MQGTKRQDAMQFLNLAVAAEVMVSVFTMTISFVFLTLKKIQVLRPHIICAGWCTSVWDALGEV
jgi:hypothetical protein